MALSIEVWVFTDGDGASTIRRLALDSPHGHCAHLDGCSLLQHIGTWVPFAPVYTQHLSSCK
jgi:hypothetical protein